MGISARRSGVAIAAAMLALAAGGAARAVQPPAGTTVVAEPPALKAVVERALGGLDGSLVRSVRIGAPPDGFMPARGPLPPGARWLYVAAIGADKGPRGVKGVWEAELLAGAVHDGAVSQGLPPIAGVSVQPVNRRGLPTGDCCFGRELYWHSATPVDDRTEAAIRKEIAATFKQSSLRLTLDSIRFQRPLGLAVELDVTVHSRFRGNGLRRALRGLVDATRYDGVLFRAHLPEATDTFALATRARTTLGAYAEWAEVESLRIPPKIWVKALLEREPLVTHPVRTKLDVDPPALREAVARVLAGLGSARLRAVRLGEPPVRYDSRGRKLEMGRGRWLYVETVAGSKAEAAAGAWEAKLLAGAANDVSTARGWPALAGVTAEPVHPDGTAARCCLPDDDRLVRRKPQPTVDATPRALVAEIRAKAARAHVTLRSIVIRQPLGLAAEVHFSMASPTDGDADRVERLLLGPRDFDGVLFKVFNPAGALVCTHGYAMRAGLRSEWTAPSCARHFPHGSWRPVAPSPGAGVSSLFVCPAADTQPSATAGASGDCGVDRGATPLAAGVPVYCTANVIARDITVEVDLLHDGVVLGATTQRGTTGSWLQTASVAAPASGAWECRVLIDSRVARSRTFDVA